MKKDNFSPTENIIKIAKQGGMYILVDDENRENEGDLVFCSSDVSSNKINFMAKYGRGLICLALDTVQAKKLGLTYMSPVNQSRNQTAFTVSIEAKKGVTTGISAKDRAKTIRVATKKNVKKKEIVSPGHVFPIISKEGGVLIRAGHTEASVDISKLAKKNSSAVICEIMDDDGKMARGEKLYNFGVWEYAYFVSLNCSSKYSWICLSSFIAAWMSELSSTLISTLCPVCDSFFL